MFVPVPRISAFERAIEELSAEQRLAAIAEVIEEAGIRGTGGDCAQAAVAINLALFAGRGVYVGGFNAFLLEHDHPVGHVAVEVDGVCWDCDAVAKSRPDIGRWGILPDDAYYRGVVTAKGGDFDTIRSAVRVIDLAPQSPLLGQFHMDEMPFLAGKLFSSSIAFTPRTRPSP